MISPTGTPPERRAGFTLIELLLVVAILLVILSVLVPRFRRSYEALAVKNAAFDLYQALHFAKGHALAGQRSVRLRFDFDHARYRLEEEIPAEANRPPSLPEFQPIPGRFGRSSPASVSWTLQGAPPEIVCRPDGFCDPGKWQLRSDDDVFELAVEDVTSEITMKDLTAL